MSDISPTEPLTWKLYKLTRDVKNPNGDGRHSSWHKARVWKAGLIIVTRDGTWASLYSRALARRVPLKLFEGSIEEWEPSWHPDLITCFYDLNIGDVFAELVDQGILKLSDIKKACIDRARRYAQIEAEEDANIRSKTKAPRAGQQQHP